MEQQQSPRRRGQEARERYVDTMGAPDPRHAYTYRPPPQQTYKIKPRSQDNTNNRTVGNDAPHYIFIYISTAFRFHIERKTRPLTRKRNIEKGLPQSARSCYPITNFSIPKLLCTCSSIPLLYFGTALLPRQPFPIFSFSFLFFYSTFLNLVFSSLFYVFST